MPKSAPPQRQFREFAVLSFPPRSAQPRGVTIASWTSLPERPSVYSARSSS